MKILDKELLNKTLDDRFNDYLLHNKIAGASVLVAQNDEIVYKKHFGYKNVYTKEEINDQTLYRLASMTKPFSGIAFLIGLENGWYKMEDDVSDYLPYFKDLYVGRIENGKVVKDHIAKNSIKMWMLLSNSSGFMVSDEIGNLNHDSVPLSAYETLESYVKYCADNCPLSYEPGTGASYSGYAAFSAFAVILEQKSGMTYEDFIKEKIWKPLNIKDVTFKPTDEQWDRMISMHDRTSGGLGSVTVDMGKHTFESFPIDFTCPGCSMAGSLEDYYKFTRLLLGKGEIDGIRISNPDLFPLMTRRYIDRMGYKGREFWGLGVRVVSNTHTRLDEGSFGWSGAYGCHFWVDPKNNIIAILLRNSRYYDSHGCGVMGGEFEKAVMTCAKEVE